MYNFDFQRYAGPALFGPMVVACSAMNDGSESKTPLSARSTIWLLNLVLGCLTLLLVCAPDASAQKRLKLKQADQLRSGRDPSGEKIERAIGNVVFNQNTTTIYCDSAYFYKSRNAIAAFGRIRITEGDSVTITGNSLEYDGNKKHAKLRKNVVFTKLATSTLYTDNLDYSRPNNLAFYFNGGKLVDSINVLTSVKGYYNVNNNLASFKKDVVVTHPDYIMKSDSLQYNSRSKIIYFREPTNVFHRVDSSTFVYEGGEYDTRARQSVLDQGTGETKEYKVVSKD